MDVQSGRTIIIAILISWLGNTKALIGYDCGSASANITTLSLLNIEECDISSQEINCTKVHVQLLQINEFQSVRVIQCKVEIDRLIRRCGMFSHSMDVYNGKHAYIQEVSRSLSTHAFLWDLSNQQHSHSRIEI